MSKINTKRVLVVSGVLLAISAAPSAFAQALKATAGPAMRTTSVVGILPPPPPIPIPPAPTQSPLDSRLYTNYMISNAYTYLNWVECGATLETEGCYASGSLGPFGKIGAMMADQETVNSAAGTITQNIYVVDEATGGGTGVTLYVYQKTDAITATSDTTRIALTNTMSLPLIGGINATTYMAANANCIFIGTNQSASATRIQKSNFGSQQVGGFSPPINVSSITTDRYGNVTVTFGGGSSSGGTGFISFDSHGNSTEDGGGADFMLNATNGVSTGNGNGAIISAATKPDYAQRLHVRLKQPTSQVSH